MTLPWISREAYRDMRAERDRLLTLVERLTDHGIRSDRKALGLPESPPAPKAPVSLSPAVRDACAAWGAREGEMLDTAMRLLRQGQSEAYVLDLLGGDEP